MKKRHNDYKQYECNNENLEKINIGHRFQTDVSRLTLPMLKSTDKNAYQKMLSFMYALLEGISSVFYIERKDIDGILELNLEQNSYDILLFDNVPGGAGHVKRLLDEKAMMSSLNAAFKKVSQSCCDEDTSCYNCLRNYYNQTKHGLLKRVYAKDVIKQICDEINS